MKKMILLSFVSLMLFSSESFGMENTEEDEFVENPTKGIAQSLPMDDRPTRSSQKKPVFRKDQTFHILSTSDRIAQEDQNDRIDYQNALLQIENRTPKLFLKDNSSFDNVFQENFLPTSQKSQNGDGFKMPELPTRIKNQNQKSEFQDSTK